MFYAYETSLDLIKALRELLPSIQQVDADLADQIKRAASSVSLNLGEGRRRRAGDQRRHYEIAHGSASEVKAAIDVAKAWGWLVEADRVLELLDQLLAMMWRLTNGRQIKPSKGRGNGERAA